MNLRRRLEALERRRGREIGPAPELTTADICARIANLLSKEEQDTDICARIANLLAGRICPPTGFRRAVDGQVIGLPTDR